MNPISNAIGSLTATENSRVHVGNNIYPPDDNACLKHLRVTDPRHDKARIEESKGGLLKDSYRWIIDHDDFKRWHCDEQSSLLWIKGDPGKGKTMLLCGIINELEKSNDSSIVAYFFCQATDARINNATAVLRSLIFLLVDQQPLLVSHVREKYDAAGKLLFEDKNAWWALSEIFVNILQDPTLARTFFIIDAVDECMTDLASLLRWIVKISSEYPRVKWIISSRNERHIEEQLDMSAQKVKLCLELNEKVVSEAVGVYINFKVEQLAKQKKYYARMRKFVRDYLLLNAADTFLWVALVCQELANPSVTKRKTLSKLLSFPPGLDALYSRILDSICTSDDAVLCKQVLAITTIVCRPVTLKEMTALVLSSEHSQHIGTDDYVDEMRDIIKSCGSFLTIKGDSVYVIHQSAEEYLSGSAKCIIFPDGSGHIHCALFSQSIHALSMGYLRRDIYELDDPGVLIGDIVRPDPDPLAAIRYACSYWIYHLFEWNAGESDAKGQQDLDGKAYLFLQKHFLHWLEALSLSQAAAGAVFSLGLLESQLREQSPPPQLLDFVYDARRFLLRNLWVVENAPLQIYSSALLFSPSESIVKKSFNQEEPEWVTMKPPAETKWGSCLQTFEGHGSPVKCITFSHDSQHVASGSVDGTVNILNTTTGTMVQTFRIDGSITSAAFSHDLIHFASGSSDGIVTIWDTIIGAKVQTLRGHRSITSVAYSHDATVLAIGSEDGTVSIRDIITGTTITSGRINDSSSSITSVAFSHDSKFLAMGTLDGLVMIWDTIIGTAVEIFRGQYPIISPTFSHDSKLLAFGMQNGIVGIGDTTTGTTKVFSATKHITSAAFSPDSRFLAIGSKDGQIGIGDTIIGDASTLHTSSSITSALAFSHDSRLLASGSLDGIIKVWDTTMNVAHTLHTSGNIASIAFLHNLKLLVIGSEDGTVRLGDTGTGDATTSDTSSAIANVPRILASASPAGIVRILDIEMDATQTFHSSGYITSVAFSHDSTLLASGAEDGTVNILDTTTGAVVQTLCRGESITPANFSHDLVHLASGPWDAMAMPEATTATVLLHHESGSTKRTVVNSSVLLPGLPRPGLVLKFRSQQGTKTTIFWDAKTRAGQTIRSGSPITSVAFSHDSSLLASGSQHGTVKIWNTTTGARVHELIVGNAAVHNLAFDANSSFLLTNLGPIRLNDTNTELELNSRTTQETHHQSYSLAPDRTWIMWQGSRVLWIPPDYRAPPSAISSSGFNIAMIYSSRQVIIVGFSGPPTLRR